MPVTYLTTSTYYGGPGPTPLQQAVLHTCRPTANQHTSILNEWHRTSARD